MSAPADRGICIALITGDREWTDGHLIYEVLAAYRPQAIIEGECRGADLLARYAAERLDILVDPRPADWAAFGPAAGPIRNREMAALKPDCAFAFHDALWERSRGTRDMVKTLHKLGVSVLHVSHACPRGGWLFPPSRGGLI